MADPAPKLASYNDLFNLPEHVVGQIIDGELYTHPRPAPKHARATTRLSGKISGSFDSEGDGPGGWVILYEPELHLGANIVVPDLAGWRRERMPEIPVDKAYFELAPDWVCEVLSPNTTHLDRGPKRKVYEQQSVKHIWFVDPEAQTLEVFELIEADGHDGYRLVEVFSSDAIIRAIPFDAIEFALGTLWSR